MYCASNRHGTWNIETVYAPSRSGNSDNYGPVPYSMIVDANNDIHIFAGREGWWNYGGTAWEFVRSSTAASWTSPVKIAEFTDMPVDTALYSHFSTLVNSSGTITVIMARQGSNPGSGDKIFYVSRSGSTGSWSSPSVMDDMDRSNPYTLNFDGAIDSSGNVHVVYVKESLNGSSRVLYSKNFGSSSVVYTSENEIITELKLHSNSSGELTLFINRKGKNSTLITKNSSGNWSSLTEIKTAAPDGNVSQAQILRSDTSSGIFTEFAMIYSDREASGQTSPGPFGPDKIYYYSQEISENEDCSEKYEEGYQAGKQYCINHPEECGIITEGGYTQADLEAEYYI